eukprot:COSAG01_NODE_39211_length_479_cov_1.613158_1_plen_42_part_10
MRALGGCSVDVTQESGERLHPQGDREMTRSLLSIDLAGFTFD